MGLKFRLSFIPKIIIRSHVILETRQKVSNIGCIGKKAGMTTLFMPSGEAIPCTVISIGGGNYVTGIKNKDEDGYNAIQVGFMQVSEKRSNKPEMGHLAKNCNPPLRHLLEYKVEELPKLNLGQKLESKELFQNGDLIDIAGKSIGKGFQGGIKKWNMHRGFMIHGSKSHRSPGSIGMRYSGDGGRVMPGLKMPGNMGNKRVTVPRRQIINIDTELEAIVVRGTVPGKPGSILSLTPAKFVGKSTDFKRK